MTYWIEMITRNPIIISISHIISSIPMCKFIRMRLKCLTSYNCVQKKTKKKLEQLHKKCKYKRNFLISKHKITFY